MKFKTVDPVLFWLGLVIVVSLISLACFVVYASKQEKQNHIAFMAACNKAGINNFECEHMYKVERDASSASSSAAFAAGASGFAAGMAAGRVGR